MLQPASGEKSDRRVRLLALGALALLVFSVFSDALRADFVNWDDGAYVYENVHIQELDWGRILRSPVVGNFHPVTMLSLAVERMLFGLDPFWFHLTNVTLHAANSVLVVLLLGLVPGVGFTAAWLCGLLFAIHPLHVESVAWISERKDLLSTFFYLLALLAYVRFLAGRDWRSYAGALGATALALLSKPMAVTLPFALLLLDYAVGRPLRGRALVEKAPFLALAAATALATVIIQGPRWLRDDPTFDATALPVYQLDLFGRVALAGESLLFYVAKTLAPLRLAAHYEWELARLEPHQALLGLLGLAAAAALCWIRGPSRRAARFGLLFFLLTILPVLKLLPFGQTSRFNDRYMYLPSIGFFLVFALPFRNAPSWSSLRRGLALAVGGLVLLVLVSLTQAQVRVWRDGESLWRDILAKYPGTPVALNNLGMVYLEAGQEDLALQHFEEAIQVKPDFGRPHYLLGRLWEGRGDLERAREHYERAAALDPLHFGTRVSVGLFHVRTRNVERGLEHYHAALELDPDVPELHYNIGNAYFAQGERREAREAWERAVELDPELALARRALGYLYLQDADEARALEHLERLQELGRPVDPDVLARLRRALGR